jgi:hypothetical protein
MTDQQVRSTTEKWKVVPYGECSPRPAKRARCVETCLVSQHLDEISKEKNHKDVITQQLSVAMESLSKLTQDKSQIKSQFESVYYIVM